LINGFSQIGEEDTSVYLDEPRYRQFWAEVEKLNVPVYLHPRRSFPASKRGMRDIRGCLAPRGRSVRKRLCIRCV